MAIARWTDFFRLLDRDENGYIDKSNAMDATEV